MGPRLRDVNNILVPVNNGLNRPFQSPELAWFKLTKFGFQHLSSLTKFGVVLKIGRMLQVHGMRPPSIAAECQCKHIATQAWLYISAGHCYSYANLVSSPSDPTHLAVEDWTSVNHAVTMLINQSSYIAIKFIHSSSFMYPNLHSYFSIIAIMPL